MPESANIARHLPAMAAQQPEVVALKIPRGRRRNGEIDYLSLSYRELDAEVNAWGARLRSQGVRRGDRVLVMVRQGLPLIASVFALFKEAAIPVVIDPGMGLRSFLACVKRSHPRVLLGIPAARWIRHLARRSFRSVKCCVPASGSPLARLTSGSARVPVIEPAGCEPGELAAILFTSGSTGAPKGVCYEHGMFEAQVRLIRSTYRIVPGEVDLPMLPVFALFDPALGMTTVVPEIDPSRPAAVDPAKIVQAIRQERVTNSFGSPTLWNKIASHCEGTGDALPSLKRVLCAGAPVPATLWEKSSRFLPEGELHSPYGATESLPVSTIAASELLELRTRLQGAPLPGACVGRPVPEMQVKVIAMTDAPIRSWGEVTELPAETVGELVVAGPVVTREYDELPEATAAAKIPDPGRIWHRMGDCGWIDREGRIWFAGRKAERVETSGGVLHTEPCEQVFRGEKGIARCALIGLGERPRQVPALVVQAESSLSKAEQRALAERLRALGRRHAATQDIRRFYFHPRFPVDVRHNAKIHRLTLAKWAATEKGVELP